jgi:hypothetical protein
MGWKGEDGGCGDEDYEMDVSVWFGCGDGDGDGNNITISLLFYPPFVILSLFLSITIASI